MYPVLFSIGPVTIRFYGVMMAIGFLVAVYVGTIEARRKGLGVECMIDFAPFGIIGGILGARLYYVFLHIEPFLRNPVDILKIWQGGLVFHGAILGGIVSGIWFSKRKRVSFWRFADTAAPGIILAQAIGRVGCFLNGCCFGKETSVAWAVIFTNPQSMAPLNKPLHPSQLYEMAGNLMIFGLLWKFRRKKLADGYIFLMYGIMYSVLRLVLVFFRGDSIYLSGDRVCWTFIVSGLTIVFAVVCLWKCRESAVR